jgi:phenylpyruvate tautomerase PptA (4-oxalocrotonate tautomerase family)
MPLIQLDTSCDLATREKKDTLALGLSGLAASVIGKPEQYVMAVVYDNVAMTMAGETGDCALVTVKSIGGLNRNINQTLASEVCKLLDRELNIVPERVYLTCMELPATHWGWKGGTFG